MEMIQGQLWYVASSFLWGVVLMFVYDFIEAFRIGFAHGKVLVMLEDWLFWSVASLLVFQMIFALNNGIIRSFFVIAFILGMFVYRKIAKKHVQRGIIAVFSFFFRPYVWILNKIRKKRKKSLKSR